MLRVVLLQFSATAIVSVIAAMLGGMSALISALLGGLCCAVPNALFALRLHMSAKRSGMADPMSFFIGEFIKIILTALLIAAVVWLYRELNWLAFVVAFILVLKSYFVILFRH